MHKLILLALVCLVAVGTAFGEEEKNLVLGRPYTYWPEPLYNDCKDDADITQLTDGETQYAGNMWMHLSCVGWARGINVPVVMHFDLGQEATLSELRFNTAGGGGAGVVEVGLRIFVSLDDKSYVLAGEHTAPPTPGNIRVGVQVKTPLNAARARYVAVVAMAPAPHYFVFVDEIEIIGKIPADPKSIVPILSAIPAGGARGLQEVLAGGRRASDLLGDLVAPVERQIACRPEDEARARKVYAADTLVWEVPPDDAFRMLSLPEALDPPQSASIHTVAGALEAAALGVANLTDTDASLTVEVSAGPQGAPVITPRVARFFETTTPGTSPTCSWRPTARR